MKTFVVISSLIGLLGAVNLGLLQGVRSHTPRGHSAAATAAATQRKNIDSEIAEAVKSGNVALAKQKYEKGLQEVPNEPMARLAYADFLKKTGDKPRYFRELKVLMSERYKFSSWQQDSKYLSDLKSLATLAGDRDQVRLATRLAMEADAKRRAQRIKNREQIANAPTEIPKGLLDRRTEPR